MGLTDILKGTVAATASFGLGFYSVVRFSEDLNNYFPAAVAGISFLVGGHVIEQTFKMHALQQRDTLRKRGKGEYTSSITRTRD